MTHRDVAVEVTVAAPIDTVWRALRHPVEIRRWHGWEMDGLDEEIEQIYRTGVVEEVATGPRRRLDTGESTFEVEAAGPSTVVRVVLTAPPEDPAWQGWYEDVRQGWITFVQQLRFALERHPGEDRTSLLLAGVPADGRSVVDLLAAGTPEPVTGTTWFRSEHQLGRTVAEWGDGLLIVSDRFSPAGTHAAFLTAYGTRPSDAWVGWWKEHHPA